MVSAATAERILAELERLLAEARGCQDAAPSIEARLVWDAYVERLERRRDELSRQMGHEAATSAAS